jgi:hypothetical protein
MSGALVVSLLALSQALVGPGFVRIGGGHGVEVYRRPHSQVIELAAVGELDAPPAEVQAALLDCTQHPRFVPTVAECQVLARKRGEQLVYQRLDLPAIKDRDYSLKVVWNQGRTRAVRYTIDSRSGPPPTNKAVRLSVMNGRWVLEPIRGGKATRATYQVQLDLAGKVPVSMVRSGAARDLPRLFEGMRRLVAGRARRSG